MVVQHNIPAMNANRYFGINNSGLSKSLEKLSSGYAINRAGDNAAGLAVSEKMRSQIAGLTQGVKNAQDGISMIQTFEGALTETDSILQRMKTLADQAANGTYQDDVDRDAIQLEFDQLNDELNQIADTDFNGVVVLNGGQMADGLKQVDGKFDYSLKQGQIDEANAKALADAQAAAQKKIDSAQKAFDSAKNVYKAVNNRDLCIESNAVKWNELDNNYYTNDVAETLFKTATNEDGDTLADAKVESFNVQFVFDGTDWKVANDSNINDVKTASGNPDAIEAKPIVVGDAVVDTGAWYVNDDGETVKVDISVVGGFDDAEIKATPNGGFVVNNSKYGNAVFASKEAKAGDVVTLTYTNTAKDSYAPTNIGIDENSLNDRVGLYDKPVLTLSDDAKDDSKMNQEMMDALTKLDNANITFEYAQKKISASIDNEDLVISDGEEDATAGTTSFKVSFVNQDGKEIELATVTMQNGFEASNLKNKKSEGALKTTPGYATGTTGAIKAGSATFTYSSDGTWKDSNGNTTVTVGGTAIDPSTGVDTTKKVSVGDKITISWGDATAGAQAAVNSSYTQAAKASFDLGTAATKAESIELTYDGTNWVKADGATFAATDTIGGQAAGNFDTSKLIEGTKLVKGDKITLSVEKDAKGVSVSTRASDASVGKVTFGVALDEGKYDPSSVGPTIKTALSPNGVDSRSIDESYNNAKEALSAAKAAYPKTVDDLPKEDKVSVSDALNNATAPLTYTDHVMLQAGARSKDLVDFTFKYSSGGLGDLKANMNCSAREDGLGTANLSLKTAKDANYAIDRIDNAINKVSMVRATFGAVQNRLEHKIDNMNVTKENMTSAESRIRDTNMAEEMTNFTKNQILSQASQAMLAQANQLPQGVLQLLG